jgi:hypothetical protein
MCRLSAQQLRANVRPRNGRRGIALVFLLPTIELTALFVRQLEHGITLRIRKAVPGRDRQFGVRGVNYFRLLTTTISAGRDRQGASPTTRRHSVIVVGRLVAVENVSAGAPIGA